MLYAFHFPHLLSPQIERSAHRGLYRQHILGIIVQGPALCLAAAGFSLFFYPAVSPAPAQRHHSANQQAWDVWPSTRVWGCDPLREGVWKDLPEPGRAEVEERELQARWAGPSECPETERRETPDSVLAELQLETLHLHGREYKPHQRRRGQLLPLPALW